MKFVSVRELSLKPAKVWKALKKDGDIIITSNGRPIAILTGVDENNLEASLQAIKQARACLAMETMQERSVKAGLDKLTQDEIEKEIKSVRKARDERGA